MANNVTPEEGDVGFQIAPMVDVVFVLLLFFMAVAGSQLKPGELGVNLPSDGRSEGSVIVPIVITVSAEGQVQINSRVVDASSDKDLVQMRAWFRETISKFGDKDPVIVRPDPQARQERIIDVLNAAAAAGVKNLTFG